VFLHLSDTQYCACDHIILWCVKKKQDEVCEKFAFETIAVNRKCPVQKFAPTAQWVFLETQRMV